MEQEYFTDISIFQGIVQFLTDTGEEIRAEGGPNGIYKIFVRSGNNFLFERGIRVRSRNQSPRSIFHFLEQSRETDYD